MERRGIRETRKKEGGEEKEWEVIFWNMADLSNKDMEFLERLNTVGSVGFNGNINK